MEPRTLHGCLIVKNKTETVILREYGAITGCTHHSSPEQQPFGTEGGGSPLLNTRRMFPL